MLSNISILILFIIPLFLFYYLSKQKKESVSNKTYKKITIIIFITVYIIQLVLSNSIYFYTDWDPEVIRNHVDYFIENKNLERSVYLTIYPNNILLVFFLVLIKAIPIIGKHYFTTIAINCLFVSLAALFTSLTIKNLLGNKTALKSYIIMIPIMLMTPWITIPYTDTVGILFPILTLYIYAKKQKNKKDWLLIGLIATLGYYIKPTIVLTLIAILIVELLNKIKIKNISYIILGTLIAITINTMATNIIKFKPAKSVENFNFIHYLAQGQNNQTLGVYNYQDFLESIKNSKEEDYKKFKERIKERNLYEHITFYTKKTLLNFNDGSFNWGKEGTFFYKIRKTENKLSIFLREIYYKDGKYYQIFLQISQTIWLLILFFCPFITLKKNNKTENVIMLSIILVTIFLTIFEPRTRYLYCYLPFFIIAFIIGIKNLKNKINVYRNNQYQLTKK